MRVRDVDISIVNHENQDALRRCLAALPRACEGLDWHATVVDNASGDQSLDMLASEFPDVRVVANETARGFGENHNQVLRMVLEDRSARFALVLNDDTELAPGAVTTMVRALEACERAGAIAPTIVDPEGRTHPSRLAYPTAASALRFDLTGKTEQPDATTGWLQGCCLLLRVAALRQVGLFDERFFLFYEDADLSRRFESAGWLLVVCTDATVVHALHSTVFQPTIRSRALKQGLRSRYLYFSKHGTPVRALLVSILGRVGMSVRALLVLVRSRGGRGAARARARSLWELACYDPRRPVFPEHAAEGR